MENLYLTKLEQAIKDGNYKLTDRIYIPSQIEFREFNHNGTLKNLAAYESNPKIGLVYKITFYYQISGNDFYQLLPCYRENLIDYHLSLEDYDLKYILPENYFRDIDYNINRKNQIDFFAGIIDETYSKDYYITESEIEKIKENIFTKEIEMEKRMLLKVMEVNDETTTKKRGRL